MFARISGLTALAKHYPALSRPEGVERARQTVKVGVVRYRRCVTLVVSSSGLYLWVRPVLSRYTSVLIPWREVREILPTRLYGRRAVRLSIGNPEVGAVIVYEALFKVIQPHLDVRFQDHS